MVEFQPDGVRPPVTWERKSLADLAGTLTKGYERFKAEFLGAKAAGLTLVLLVEASLTDIGRGHRFGQTPGSQLIQQLFTLQVRYQLPMVFCQDRGESALTILEYGKAVGREWVAYKQREN